MSVALILLAVPPTAIAIFLMLHLLTTATNFDWKSGEISDLNLQADTRYSLFVIIVFWETCQAAFLIITHTQLARGTMIPVILLLFSLVSGLIGMLFKSRTMGHQTLIALSVALSVIVMIMESVLVVEFVVLAVLILTGLYLMRSVFTKATPHYWKLEILILMCYMVWNTLSAFVLR